MRYLFLPATLLTLAVNLIPLYGVLFWGWDTFQLLMLYWIETVIIAVFTIRRLTVLPQEGVPPVVKGDGSPSGFGLAGFFTLHAGMFIGVHFIFLWAFFSWDWIKRVHGVGSFFYELLVAHGVWVALLAMLLVHWIAYLTEPRPGYAIRVESGVGRRLARGQTRETGDPVMPIIGGLYVRIVIMQIAIIFGAWFSGFSGSLAPLVIVIVLKTLIDLGLGAYAPLKAATASARAGDR
jgi:hypothetical protein